MTGLKRRLAENEARDRLRAEIETASNRTRGARATNQELLEDAIDSLEEQLQRKEREFELTNNA